MSCLGLGGVPCQPWALMRDVWRLYRDTIVVSMMEANVEAIDSKLGYHCQ